MILVAIQRATHEIKTAVNALYDDEASFVVYKTCFNVIVKDKVLTQLIWFYVLTHMKMVALWLRKVVGIKASYGFSLSC